MASFCQAHGTACVHEIKLSESETWSRVFRSLREEGLSTSTATAIIGRMQAKGIVFVVPEGTDV